MRAPKLPGRRFGDHPRLDHNHVAGPHIDLDSDRERLPRVSGIQAYRHGKPLALERAAAYVVSVNSLKIVPLVPAPPRRGWPPTVLRGGRRRIQKAE